MGKIIDQTLKGGIFSYVGVVFGAITTGYLMPNWLSSDELGVTKLLVSYSALLAQFATLGSNAIIARMFSYFRNNANRHNGFFGIIIRLVLVGFVLTVSLFYFGLPAIKSMNSKAELFIEFLEYALPLTLFTLLFTVIDSYYTQLYNALRGVVYREFVSRVLVFISLFLFHWEYVGYSGFLILYVLSWSAPGILLLYNVLADKLVGWNSPKGYLTPELIREIRIVGLFGVLQGYSGVIVLNLDSIMLASFLGDGETGIYAVTFFAGTLVLIPSRPLQKIATAYYADSWRNDDLDKIEEIYSRSSINQFLIGALVFILIWVNLEDMFSFLPVQYMQGKYVVFFIAMANWIDMASGANVSIISTSKHYRMLTLFALVLMILLVVTNYIFIPMWGVVGAAFASMLSTLGFNLMRWSFLYVKYDLQPLTLKHLWTVILFGVLILLIPFVSIELHPIFSIAIKTALVLLLFCASTIAMRISDELNFYAQKLYQKIFRR